jgi:hypothetical protein
LSHLMPPEGLLRRYARAIIEGKVSFFLRF